ncbi:MAG: GAF domain-containing sensor histidine kinase [Flavobacteriales bacterium]|nr:MAG: GAF domain-containing sensor histidine kinase [Flavobacteriales bacterium]
MTVTKDLSNFQEDIQNIAQIPAVANILEVICSATGMGFAAVARVTPNRWIACAVNDKINFGLGIGGELKVETTICHEIREHRKVVAIDHVAEDGIYKNHPTPAMYGLQSYISMPITLKNGELFGTLCAIDPKPAFVNNEKTIQMFSLFAELIAFHLDSLQQLSRTELRLGREQQNAELREQFIAMLGHDLRNPVHAIANATQLLQRGELDERQLKLATIIQDANIRTKGLIDNILDFASGRLGGGIKLNFDNRDSLQTALQQVITELKMAYPERNINVQFSHIGELKADYQRIAQLFSNLLGNALTHGKSTEAVFINTKNIDGNFILSVTNGGNKIADETLPHLFKPFSRGTVVQGKDGLGLGLFIAQEIAKAHKGQLTVSSDDTSTCFTLTIAN